MIIALRLLILKDLYSIVVLSIVKSVVHYLLVVRLRLLVVNAWMGLHLTVSSMELKCVGRPHQVVVVVQLR